MTDAQLPQAPPPPEPTGAIPSHDRTLPIVVYVLYLVAITNGLTGIIGFIIALGSRAGAAPAIETHYRFQIRSFIGAAALWLIGAVICVVALPLTLIVIGFPLMHLGVAVCALGGIYLLVRAIIGLIRLANGEPYPNPDSWTL